MDNSSQDKTRPLSKFTGDRRKSFIRNTQQDKKHHHLKMALGYNRLVSYPTSGSASSKYLTDHEPVYIKVEEPDDYENKTTSSCLYDGRSDKNPNTTIGTGGFESSFCGTNMTISSTCAVGGSMINYPNPMLRMCLSPIDPRATKKSGMKRLLMDDVDTEPLTSWTTKHPQNWTKKEVLDWVYYVVEQENLDGSRVKGEAYREFTGSQLMAMSRKEFQAADPVYGRKMYQTFKALVTDMKIEEPRNAPYPSTLDNFNQVNHDHVTQLTRGICHEILSGYGFTQNASMNIPSSTSYHRKNPTTITSSHTNSTFNNQTNLHSVKREQQTYSVSQARASSSITNPNVGNSFRDVQRKAECYSKPNSPVSSQPSHTACGDEGFRNDLVVYTSGNDVEVDLPSLGIYTISTDIEFPSSHSAMTSSLSSTIFQASTKLSSVSAFTAPLSPPSPTSSPSASSDVSVHYSSMSDLGFFQNDANDLQTMQHLHMTSSRGFRTPASHNGPNINPTDNTTACLQSKDNTTPHSLPHPQTTTGFCQPMDTFTTSQGLPKPNINGIRSVGSNKCNIKLNIPEHKTCTTPLHSPILKSFFDTSSPSPLTTTSTNYQPKNTLPISKGFTVQSKDNFLTPISSKQSSLPTFTYSRQTHCGRNIAIIPPTYMGKDVQTPVSLLSPNIQSLPSAISSSLPSAISSSLISLSPLQRSSTPPSFDTPSSNTCREKVPLHRSSSTSSGYHSKADSIEREYSSEDINGIIMTHACAIDDDDEFEIDCQDDDVLLCEKKKIGRRGRPHAAKTGNHLWEFVRDLLRDPKCNPMLLKWEDKENGVFRFVQSEQVATLWGQKKNNPLMTYEKLSRAMRFCRKAGYFKQVPKTGKFPKKLCFMFGDKAHSWKD